MDELTSSPDSASWATKRRFPRFVLETHVIVTELRPGTTRAVKGWSRDVCEGGLGGIVGEGLKDDDEVLVEFPLPSARQQMLLRARVHRHSASHYGFEFLQTSPAVLRDIRQACQRLPIHK